MGSTGFCVRLATQRRWRWHWIDCGANPNCAVDWERLREPRCCGVILGMQWRSRFWQLRESIRHPTCSLRQVRDEAQKNQTSVVDSRDHARVEADLATVLAANPQTTAADQRLAIGRACGTGVALTG